MKNIKYRKKLLALLISGNILLTGCSITGQVSTKKNNDLSSSSYTQSSIDTKESNLESSKNLENIIDEVSDIDQSIIESSDEITESSEEIEEEHSVGEISIIDDETSIEEVIESENYDLEEDSYNQYSVDDESSIVTYTNDNNYIKAKTDVNIRYEPNMNSSVISTIHEGNTLKKLGYIDNWYIVDFNGQTAYVSMKYTEEIGEEELIADLNVSNICYFPYGATLFSNSELTDKILDIPVLESGQIISQEGNVYLVDTLGYNGYVSINSVNIILGPVIIVDKSEQTLRLYKNNNLVMEFPVVTGNEDPNFYHPSDEGLFSIYSKKYDAELVGDTWDVVVNVFMGYNGGEGIHDAVWRSYFGGDIYTYDGSHGCINCPYDNVMALAQEVEVGDKVLVKR